MPNNENTNAHRRLVLKLCLYLVRELHADYRPHEPFGRALETLMIMVALRLAQLEGRPMSAHKVALFLDMGRMTVRRRLDQLVEEGAVRENGHAVISLRVSDARVSKIVREITDTAAELHNLSS